MSKLNHIFTAALLAIILALTCSNRVWADEYIAPDSIKVKTPVYRPEFADFDPALGSYTYTVSWQGIPAATVTVNVDQDEMYYHLNVNARTYSGIDIFYKLRYSAEGLVSSYDLSPIKTTIDHRENSRIKNISIQFYDDGRIEASRVTNKEQPKVLNFNPDNFTLDPFSAAFLARSLRWEKGQSRAFDTFNGKSRYLITLTCEDEISMKVNDLERKVWVITPKVENLSYPTSNNKLRSAEIYVTADKSREILQIVSKVFVGSVSTRMVSFKESEKHIPLTRVARNRTGSYLQ